jgi:fermentation-respiration switch protein FrsA (DUF1100 family)
VNLPFARITFPSGDRTLIGWWVRAPGRVDTATGAVLAHAPAVLFFHGNRSSLSDYVALQRFFHAQGISSFVFDYTGFGASGGTPSLENAVADAGVAARLFADSAGPDARKVAFGSALGATVLLQAIDSVQPHVSGVIIEGVTASVREAAVRDGHIPSFVAPLVVDIADNVQAARRVRVPLLAIHSRDDNRFPIADAERVVEAVRGRAVLLPHWRPGHSAILASSRTCDWQPALDFIRSGSLPPAPVSDAADPCAESAPVAGADSTRTIRADSAGAISPRQSRTSPDSSRSSPPR